MVEVSDRLFSTIEDLVKFCSKENDIDSRRVCYLLGRLVVQYEQEHTTNGD